MEYREQLPHIYRALASSRRARERWKGLSEAEKERICARAARVRDEESLRLLMMTLDDSEWGAEYF